MNVKEVPAIPVLSYHSISDTPRTGGLRWSVSPGDFDEQMALIKQRGRTALTVSRYAALLLGREPMPPDPVVVTFDDGWADLATTALPILLRHGVKATAYVITSRLAGPRGRGGAPVLNWDQVTELHERGVEIGSHSHSHRPLDCLSAPELSSEATVSKRVLEDGLRSAVCTFAYPFGYHGDRVRRAVLLAGYTSACAVKNALSHRDDDVFAIARVFVERDTRLAGVESLLDGAGWPLAWHGEHLKTRGWRAYRRARQALTARPPSDPWEILP